MKKSKISKIKKFCFGLLATSALGMCVWGGVLVSEPAAIFQSSSVAAAEAVPVTEEASFETNELADQTIEITGLTDKGITEISDLTIPDQIGGKNVTKIGENAFAGLKITKSVKLPENLKTIGEGAFKNVCFGDGTAKAQTVEVTIPATVTEICDGAFRIEETAISSSNKFENDKLSIKFAQESQLKRIGAYAFAGGCVDANNDGNNGIFATRSLSLTIPKSVTEIGDYAFYLANLSSFDLEDDSQLQTIGDYAFAGKVYTSRYSTSSGRDSIDRRSNHTVATNTISSVTIPASVTKIGNSAFFLNTSLSELKFEEGKESQLQTIGDYAFAGAIYEKSYSLSPSIGVDSMEGALAKNLITSITIPASVTKIGNYAFYLNENLSELKFEEGKESQLQTIGDYAFAGSTYQSKKSGAGAYSPTNERKKVSNQISSISIPKSVTSIGNGAFYACENLANVQFAEESQLQTIGGSAFAGATYGPITNESKSKDEYKKLSNQISSISIPESVTSIGDYAFYRCENLANVQFAEESKLQTIGKYAFAGDVFGSSHSVGRVVSSSYDYDTYDAFCNKISSITIPKNVTSIGNYAFYSCEDLVSVEFAQGSVLKSIGESAFAGFKEFRPWVTAPGIQPKLTTIKLPDTVETIGAKAFQYCDNLTGQLIISDNVESIGSGAFPNGLEVILPSKAKFEQFKSGFSANNSTYIINIAYKTGSTTTQTDKKLFGKGLDWALVEGVWTSGQSYSLPQGTWYFSDGTKAEYDSLNSKMTSKEINDDIELVDIVLEHRVEKDGNIYATSVNGFVSGLTLDVQEVSETGALSDLLQDNFVEGVKKAYVITLRKGNEPYTEVNDLEIYFAKSLAGEYNVYLLSGDVLQKQSTSSDGYTFSGTSCTIVLKDDSVKTANGFTATLTEGFPEDVEFSVEIFTEVADMQSKLGEAYNILVKKVYVVELKQGDATYSNAGVTITVPKSFAEGLTVKLLSENELTDCTTETESYTLTGTKFVIALLRDPILSLSKSGFTATTTNNLGFADGVELQVTEITDSAELAELLGDNYNSLITKAYTVKLVSGGQPIEAEGISISVSKDFAEGLNVKLLNGEALVDKEADGENYTFTETELVLALVKDPVLSLSKSGFTATTTDDLGFADGVELQVTEITDSTELAELLGDNYNSLITKAYTVKLVSGGQPIEAEGISISVSKDFAEGLNVKLLSGESLVDKEADGENFVFTGSSFTLVLESKEKPAQGLSTTWAIVTGVITGVGLIAILLLIIIPIIRRKKRKEELEEMQK